MLPSGCFAVVGDLQETSSIEFWREDNGAERALIVRALADQRPDFVVVLGDLVFDGSSRRHWERFDALMAPLSEAGVPIVPILGNHDYGWSGRKNLVHYDRRFPYLGGERWHRRRFRALELVFLDSNSSAYSRLAWREQIRWFSEALRGADDDDTCGAALVFVHHPPFTNSCISRGSAVVRRSFLDDFLTARKTRAMLSGHVHSYERFEHGGKTFVVSGGGGGPRVRLRAARRCRQRDLYRTKVEGPPARQPCHYLSVAVWERAISVEVMGVDKGARSFCRMEAFDLELAASNTGEANAR